VIPAFLKRVDVVERGGAWSAYLEETRRETREIARRLVEPQSAVASAAGVVAAEAQDVALTDFDPDGELKVVAAALYAVSIAPDAELLASRARMTADERAAVLAAYVGKRLNRRHRPGRAFERTRTASTCSATTAPSATCSGTACSRSSGSGSRRARLRVPDAIAEAGAADDWRAVMAESAELHDAIEAAGAADAARTRCRWRIACASTWR
jgi:hypothetical protein